MTDQPWNTDFNSSVDATDPRKGDRQDVIQKIYVCKNGIGYPAVLMDIAVQGAAFTSFGPFRPDDRIVIELDDCHHIAAFVCWDNGFRTGCRFETPISAEAVRMFAGHC